MNVENKVHLHASGAIESKIRVAILFQRFGPYHHARLNAAGYSVAFLWSFALNRKWTFYHQGAVGFALLRYLLATGVAYGMNLLVVIRVEQLLGQGSLFVQIDGMLTYTAVAYVGARYFVFPRNRALSCGRSVQASKRRSGCQRLVAPGEGKP